jgi:hypothetical protein
MRRSVATPHPTADALGEMLGEVHDELLTVPGPRLASLLDLDDLATTCQ